MWVTEQTPVLLAAGAITVLVVTVQSLRRGGGGIASLRLLGVLFMWIGYHLSPAVSYLTDEIWAQYLLVPDLINDGLLFSLLCMWGYIFGYKINKINKSSLTARFAFKKLKLPEITIEILLLFTVMSLIAVLVMIGGPSELWNASYARGEGQFEERDLYGKVMQMVRVLGTILLIVTAVAGSLAVLGQKTNPVVKAVGWMAIAVALLKGMHELSRAAGYPLVILGLLALASRGRKATGIAAVSLIIAFGLGWIGYYGRGMYGPGIGNFIEAAANPEDWLVNSWGHTAEIRNPLDAMAPWTRKVQTMEYSDDRGWNLTKTWLLNLSPLPSEIFPIPGVGTNLAEVMGTVGKVGLTTPALGELYYVFRQWGSVVVIGLGALMALFDRLPQRIPGMLGLVCWCLGAMSLPLGLHNGGRAMTRPLLYGLLLYSLHLIVRRKMRGPAVAEVSPRRKRAVLV